MNTTGEYILGSIVKDAAVKQVGIERLVAGGRGDRAVLRDVLHVRERARPGAPAVRGLARRQVSRRADWRDDPAGPLVTASTASCMFIPILRAVLAAKVAENSTDYSINNTIRNMLFLPCTREQKYSAKQAIDSFFVRMGDVLSAGIVFVGTAVFALHPRGFAAINAVMVLMWLGLAWRIGREYRELAASGRAAGDDRLVPG